VVVAASQPASQPAALVAIHLVVIGDIFFRDVAGLDIGLV